MDTPVEPLPTNETPVVKADLPLPSKKTPPEGQEARDRKNAALRAKRKALKEAKAMKTTAKVATIEKTELEKPSKGKLIDAIEKKAKKVSKPAPKPRKPSVPAKDLKFTGDDEKARAVVRKVAEANGALGVVPAKTMVFLNKHTGLLAKEMLAPLGVFKVIPKVIVSVESTNVKQLGHYKPNRDGLGLQGRIVLNVKHMLRPTAQVIATLLHEMLHASHHAQGSLVLKNPHDKQFRAWASEMGIPCDSKGRNEGIDPKGKFAAYVKRHKLDGKLELSPAAPKKAKGKSTNHKWTCPCGVNVRIGTEEFDATCNKCGDAFELNE